MDNLTRNLFIIAVIVALVVFPLIYFGLTNLFGISLVPGDETKKPVIWGITFSTHYAGETLKLNWQKTFQALLEDLHIKYLRIPVYWDEIEPIDNQYNFSDYDWMMQEAKNNDAVVVFVVGQKLPRWPECFIPEWASGLSVDEKENQILEYIEATMKHFKDSQILEAWQIENEPYFNAFGSCPELSNDFFDREIDLVRSLDSRPVIVTDSGELGFWTEAVRKSDIFGSTLYRQVWNPIFGDFHHFFPPVYYRFKAAWSKIFAPGRKFWIVELQAEPWSRAPLPDTGLEKQVELMNAQEFVRNMKFAHNVGFERNYLWGAEWWYWLKERHGNNEMWDIAKKLFIEGYNEVVK